MKGSQKDFVRTWAVKDQSIEELVNVITLPENNSLHKTEWDDKNNGGHDRARSKNKEKHQVKEEQEIKNLNPSASKPKTQNPKPKRRQQSVQELLEK